MADLRLRINELPEEKTPAPIDNIAIDGPSTRRTTAAALADVTRPYSTEAQARAGVDAASTMTPERVSQAIETLGGQRFASSQQGNKADTAVQPTLEIMAGEGLSGGGTLANNITLALSSTSLASLARADSAVQPARRIVAGIGLVGGGDFSADRMLSLSETTRASLAKADTALQGPGGKAGQVYTKQSDADGDAIWQNVEAATAVSYGPQDLSEEQKEQARNNIGALRADGGMSRNTIGVQSNDKTGAVKLVSGDDLHTGYMEGWLPTGKRGWYVGWAADKERVGLVAENGLKGFEITGDLVVNAYATINSGLAAVQDVVVRGRKDKTANIHLWFRDYEQTESYAVAYWERATKDFLLSTNGMTFRFGSNGQFWAAGDLVARNVVYAGGGTGVLHANGNVQGPLWEGGYLHGHIEARCAAHAEARKIWCVTDTRFAGYLEVSLVTWEHETTGANINAGGYVLTYVAKNGQRYGMTFAARQPQIHIPAIGWRALGAW